MEPIKIKNSEIWVEDDVLIVKVSDTISIEEVIEIVKIRLDLIEKFKNIRYGVLDISEIKNIDLKAREAVSSNSDRPGGPIKKSAFICANPLARIIASFFLKKYNPLLPNKIFSNIEDAKKWFKEGVEKEN
jgi:hypothetical protein